MKKDGERSSPVSPSQRLLILDLWRRSGLAAGDFAALVGKSKHTLYTWKRKFEEQGPAGLMDRPKGGPRGSRLNDLTKRAIVMLKETDQELGCEAISQMLLRGPGDPASPAAVAKVLHEEGYEVEEVRTRPHPDKPRRFERARPNQMWQTDLFTFVLKRQNKRVHLVAFMDDHSRFIVGHGLHATANGSLVLETLGGAIANYNVPEEVLTDNGPQYVTWRGKSAFRKELEKRGIRHVVARPRHPRTLGKIERFWGTLWRGCLETAIFLDLDDARRRIELFIQHYNFHRPHQGIDGATPADRFFGAAPEVLRTLKERAAAKGDELARNGLPKDPFYVTGRVGGKNFSLHAEGDRMIMTKEGGERKEVDLDPSQEEDSERDAPEPVVILPEEGNEEPPGPGQSPLDEGLKRLAEAMGQEERS